MGRGKEEGGGEGSRKGEAGETCKRLKKGE